jgi:hypothetical protein
LIFFPDSPLSYFPFIPALFLGYQKEKANMRYSSESRNWHKYYHGNEKERHILWRAHSLVNTKKMLVSRACCSELKSDVNWGIWGLEMCLYYYLLPI